MMNVKDFFSAVKKRAAYVLGGMCAAMGFAAVLFFRFFARKTETGGGSNLEGAKMADEKFRREKEQIEKKADEAYHAMRERLSDIPACELCDGFGESCDAIHDGKGRIERRFSGFRKSLHAGRGGRDD